MNKKLLLAVSMVSFISAAQADCSGDMNGFFVGIGTGFGITKAKHKRTTKDNFFSAGYKQNKAVTQGTEATLTKGWNPSYKNLRTIADDATTFPDGTDLPTSAQFTDGTAITALNTYFQDNVAAFNTLKGLSGSNAVVYTPMTFDSSTDEYTLGNSTAVDATSADIQTLYNTVLTTDVAGGDPVSIDMSGAFTALEIDSASSGDYDTFPEYWANEVDGDLAEMEGYYQVNLTQGTPGGYADPDPVAHSKSESLGYIASSDSEIKSHRNSMNFGLFVGWQKAFDSFFFGTELGFDMIPGKIKLQDKVSTVYPNPIHDVVLNNATDKAATTKKFGTNGLVQYTSDEISFKTKWSMRLTPMFGFTNGTWAFYVPVSLKFSKLELSIARTEPTLYSTGGTTTVMDDTNNPFYLQDGDVFYTGLDNDAAANEVDSVDTGTNSELSWKKSKTRFGFEVGLGTKLMITKNIAVDLRIMYSPNQKMKVNSNAFKTQDVTNTKQHGVTENVRTDSLKGTLSVSWQF